MSEQQIPARIRVEQDVDGFWTCREARIGSPEFIRVDIAERMAEALEAILPYIPKSSASEGGPNARSCNVASADKVRSALSAFKGATQDTEARHD